MNSLISLTFDDGPNFETTIPTLDILQKYNVVGSFFVCGKHINNDTKAIIKRAYQMGCEIDNHSYTHGNMTELSPVEISNEVEKTSKLIKDTIGVNPKFFRPPYIAINQTMFDVINLPFIEGYGCTDWDNNISVEERVSTILQNAKDGNIILLHDLFGNYKTVQTIDIVIPKLLDLNFKFVTVSQLFKLKGIAPTVHKNEIYSNILNPRVCIWA